jgi:hypothetical protein
MAQRELKSVLKLMLTAPGMSSEFSLSFKVSRRHLVLFCLLVENGLNPEAKRSEELTAILSKETVAELQGLIPEILKKGGPDLLAFYEEIKLL